MRTARTKYNFQYAPLVQDLWKWECQKETQLTHLQKQYGGKFQVHYGDAVSSTKPIAAGILQSSVHGSLLYVPYTAEMPRTHGR